MRPTYRLQDDNVLYVFIFIVTISYLISQ